MSNFAIDRIDPIKLNFPALERLDLSENLIGKVHVRNFSNLKALKSLNLSNNQMHIFGPSVFENLSNLKELKLNELKIYNGYCYLISIGDEYFFKGLLKLEKLSLEGNQLELINPKVFANLPNLKDLNLSWNRLELKEENFAHLKSLKHLDLRYNHFRNENINTNGFSGGLCSLEFLNLRLNDLGVFNLDWFKDLENLKYLDLSDNYELLEVIDLSYLKEMKSLSKIFLTYPNTNTHIRI